MTPDDVQAWLVLMKERGWDQSRIARELDLNVQTITNYKQKGAPRTFAFVAAALAKKIAPWNPRGE